VTLEKFGTVLAICVAFGSAAMQCNELGEFKGITSTNISAVKNDVSRIETQQSKMTAIDTRLSNIETQQAVQNEKLQQIKDSLQKVRR
jgi:hypothetical protein